MARPARNASGQFVRARRVSRGTTAIIAVPAPKAPVRHRRRTVAIAKPTRRRKAGYGSKLLAFGAAHSRTSTVVAAAILGYAQKEGWLAKLPHVGTAGPITSFALLGWGLEELAHMKLPPLLHDMVTNALAISAFNIGVSGGQTIVGNGYGQEAYSMPGGAVFFD
jgi:hypothetical protein